jgi:transposase
MRPRNAGNALPDTLQLVFIALLVGRGYSYRRTAACLGLTGKTVRKWAIRMGYQSTFKELGS